MTRTKKDLGVAGLQTLLSVVTILFVIGLIVMIFVLMGGGLSEATQTTIQQQNGSAVWWDSDWDYKIQVTNVSGDFLVQNVTYESGMNANFSDVRWINYNETIEEVFVLDTYVASTYATFTITVPTSTNKTLYMYYGNPTV